MFGPKSAASIEATDRAALLAPDGQYRNEFEVEQGARFERAEAPCEADLGLVRLVGRIDRIDRLPEGRRAVLDYKTEGLERTRARVREPLEDTQVAFYAALLADEAVDAWYVNVGERGQTRFVPQPEVQAEIGRASCRERVSSPV